MKKLTLFLLTIFFLLPSFWMGLLAQDQVQMADELRSSGKIYIVVAVLLTILLGLILFLITVDRKVSDLEKRINKK